MKPINIMYDEEIFPHQARAAFDGAREMMLLVDIKIPIRNLGVWKQSSEAFGGIDWYISRAHQPHLRRDQLNANQILTDCLNEPWQRQEAHFELILLSFNLYSGETNNSFVLGLGCKGLGTVISTYMLGHRDQKTEYEILKTVVMHELGHVFGLVNEDRDDLDYRLGPHCANKCIMRQGLTVPEWIGFTNDRLSGNPLCPTCQKDFRKFFRK